MPRPSSAQAGSGLRSTRLQEQQLCVHMNACGAGVGEEGTVSWAAHPNAEFCTFTTRTPRPSHHFPQTWQRGAC